MTHRKFPSKPFLQQDPWMACPKLPVTYRVALVFHQSTIIAVLAFSCLALNARVKILASTRMVPVAHITESVSSSPRASGFSLSALPLRLVHTCVGLQGGCSRRVGGEAGSVNRCYLAESVSCLPGNWLGFTDSIHFLLSDEQIFR